MSLCNLLSWGLSQFSFDENGTVPFGTGGVFLRALLSGLRRCQAPGSFWLPPPGSPQADMVHELFQFLLLISTFFFLLIIVLMGVFVVVYRRRPQAAPTASPSHNTALEMVWTGIPVAIVVVLFYRGFTGYMDMRTAPEGAREIRVTGKQWQWLFEYPDGYKDADLHVPVDEPVLLVMSSEDVIHSLFIPDMEVKMDVVPGRYSRAWFRAKKAGNFGIVCSEYCGSNHSDMVARLVVHPPGEYEKWLAAASEKSKHMSPLQRGEMLYHQYSCWQCHSTDGSVGTGPSFKGIYGKPVQLEGMASITVEDNYIREHILEPGTKIVKGYQPVMPSFKGKLSDKDITALIDFIKSLK
jgi:cytochrome c oxidase subunit 2